MKDIIITIKTRNVLFYLPYKKRDAPKKEEIKCIIYKKKKEAIFLNIK